MQTKQKGWRRSRIGFLCLNLLLALFVLSVRSRAQWDIEESHTTANLRGVASVGNGVAWASGANGTVLRTEDGGYLWQPCTTPPGAEKLDFRGIQAFDENTAIVMSSGKGDLSRLYKTTDGCQTWKLLFTNPDKEGFWDAIQFETDKIGWLLGDPVDGSFYLARTFDGGSHWIRQQNKDLVVDTSAQSAFAASNSSLIAYYGRAMFGTGGKSGAFVHSELNMNCFDGCAIDDNPANGNNNRWTRMPAPVGQSTETSGIFSIAARRVSPHGPMLGQAFIAVGGDYLKADDSPRTAALTLDGGKTWTASQTPPHGYRSAVAYDLATKTWITVGPNGTDISKDDGKNWSPLKPGPLDAPEADKNWNALSLPFVVGPNGRIGKLRGDAIKP